MEEETGKLNEQWAEALVKELVHQGVRDFFFAPGSRSTALITAASSHPLVKLHHHFDERSMSFAALGFSRARALPAAIIVTSGTAVGNLYPAIMEASSDEVPLLILAADRPPEMQKIGSNQTMDQKNIFGRFLKDEWHIPTPDENIPMTTVASIGSKAFRSSVYPVPGPVLINCMFRKPLVCDSAFPSTLNQDSLNPHTTWFHSSLIPSGESLKEIASLLQKHEKGIIIVGKLDDDESLEEIFTFSLQMQWPLFADPTSNLRNMGRSSSSIPYFNSILKNTDAKESLKPTVVVHFGDQYVSGHLQDWLKVAPPEVLMHVSKSKTVDYHHSVTHRLQCSPSQFSKAIQPYLKGTSPNLWLGIWKEKSLLMEEYLTDFFEEQERLTEVGVIHTLGQTARGNIHYFFGSSLAVRYADGYFYPRDRIGKTLSTRGLSGIDGNVSQAIGATKALNSPLIAVVGDVTFMHDINALAMLTKSSLPLTLIVLNNFGNGIFSFLPIANQKECFEKHFSCPHQFSAVSFAESYSIDSTSPRTPHEFMEILKNAPNRKSPLIVEVLSDCEKNHEFLLSIDVHLKKQLKKKPSLKTLYRDVIAK